METHVRAFLVDPRVLTVFLLIAAQVAAAVTLAIKTLSFDPGKLANYYRSKVIPYILGALIVYLLTRYLPTETMGPYGAYLNDGLFTIAWLTLLWTLVAELWRTLRAIGYGLPEDPPAPTVSASGKGVAGDG